MCIFPPGRVSDHVFFINITQYRRQETHRFSATHCMPFYHRKFKLALPQSGHEPCCYHKVSHSGPSTFSHLLPLGNTNQFLSCNSTNL